jgi:SAM-dependent methyltransferase
MLSKKVILDDDRSGGLKNMTPACPYCAGPSAHLVTTRDFNRATTELTFEYFQCRQCRLVFMDPIPEDMGAFYQGGYQNIPRDLAELRSVAAQERYRLEPILRYKTSGKLLEIGPWMGIFSCNAKDAGFDVTAIELNRDCVGFLNTTLGITAIQSSDPAATMHGMQETFEVITLWHSLEHLPAPWLVVQQAARRLAPGGILLVAIPNIESHEFAVMKQHWRHLDAPRHLHFYPPESLVSLCRENGLAPLEVTTTDQLSGALSREAWHLWTSSRVRMKYVRGMARRAGVALSARKARRSHSGSGITAVFQRVD